MTISSRIGSRGGASTIPFRRTTRRLAIVSLTWPTIVDQARGDVDILTDLDAVYNIVMDFIFAIFPWFIAWPLNLKRAEKVGLCATLSLGMM